MENKVVARSMFLLRILCLVVTASSAAILSNKELSHGEHRKILKYATAYRYEVFTAALGAVYTAVQLPFAAYYAFTGRRMTRGRCSVEFDLYGDKLISIFLATGVGAGFGLSVYLKAFFSNKETQFDSDSDRNTALSLVNWGIVSSTLLLLGFVCMIIVSILSSISWTRDFFRSSTSSHGTELPAI